MKCQLQFGFSTLPDSHKDPAARPINHHIDEGLAALDEAIQVSERNEEHLNISDLYHLKGELLAYQDKDESEITACFQKAIDIAQRQNAKLMELRGLISWNRFERKQKQQSMVRQQLATTYEWFTAGFDSIDLYEAQTLLEEA